MYNMKQTITEMTAIPKMGTYYLLRVYEEDVLVAAYGFRTLEEAEAFVPPRKV